MFAIMKIVGASPDALAALHDAVQGPRCRTTEKIAVGTPDNRSSDHQPFVVIQNARLDPDHGTYTVTIGLNLVITDSKGDSLTYMPLTAILAALRSMDPQLLGDEETTIPSKKRALEIQIEQKTKEQAGIYYAIEDARSSLRGRTVRTPVSFKGEVVLTAGTIFTEDEERRLHRMNIDPADFDLPERINDPFIVVLLNLKELSIRYSSLTREIEKLKNELRSLQS